jgi:hypothetical protein
MASISVELVPLAIPTHTSIKCPPGNREDDIFPNGRASIPLNDLEHDVVLALLSEMREAVMSNWAKARMQGDPR